MIRLPWVRRSALDLERLRADLARDKVAALQDQLKRRNEENERLAEALRRKDATIARMASQIESYRAAHGGFDHAD